MEHKPGFWAVIGRKNLPFGEREDRQAAAKEAVQIWRFIRRYRWANARPEKRTFLRKSQLWPQDFTDKLFCNVEFWRERLLKLFDAEPFFVAPFNVRLPALKEQFGPVAPGLLLDVTTRGGHCRNQQQ